MSIPAAPMPSPLYRYKITKEAPAMTLLNHIDAEGDELRIDPYDENVALVRATESAVDASVYVDHDAAPAVALAILEAAGWTRHDGDVGEAIENLDSYVHPEEDERIDAEALAMLNAAFTSRGMEPVHALPEQIADFWRAAAYAARTIHAHN